MTDVRATIVAAFSEASDAFATRREALLAGADVPIAEFGLDSLTRFEILMKIEEDLDIELDDDELVSCTRFNELVGLVERLTRPETA